MAGNIEYLGEVMTGTTEQRLADLEAARKRDNDLIKSTAGQLRKVKDAKSLDEVIQVLLVVAGQLEAVGKGG